MPLSLGKRHKVSCERYNDIYPEKEYIQCGIDRYPSFPSLGKETFHGERTQRTI